MTAIVPDNSESFDNRHPLDDSFRSMLPREMVIVLFLGKSII